MAGRPTTYKQEYNIQAEKLCKLGATDEELANFFEVCEDTINEWKRVHKEFSLSIKRGKIEADSNVAERLYQRALGFEHPSEEIKVISGGSMGSMIERVPITKVYPPDTSAAIFWLKNRQPKKWRDKVETGFTNGDGDDVSAVTIFQLPDNGRNAIQGNPTAEGLPNEGAQ